MSHRNKIKQKTLHINIDTKHRKNNKEKKKKKIEMSLSSK